MGRKELGKAIENRTEGAGWRGSRAIEHAALHQARLLCFTRTEQQNEKE